MEEITLGGMELIITAVGVTVFVLILFYLLWRSRKQLREKDEKIKWLRQIAAENEHRYITKAHKTEKRIIELDHKISELETRANEGTKNQVVSKIEAEQNKRARVLKRAGFDPEGLSNE